MVGDRVIEEFLEWYRNLGVSEETIATVRRHLEAFSQRLKRRGKSLEDFDHRDVMRCLAWMATSATMSTLS